MPRIHIIMEDEDPRKFALRVADVFKIIFLFFNITRLIKEEFLQIV